MFKKVNNFVFITLFLLVLFVPLIFAKWESGGVSEEENRNLAKFPALVTEGQFNSAFTKDFEIWFMDHMGFRKWLIDENKELQQVVFNRSLTTSDVKVGRTGDYIYATDAIIKDYAHVNLRTEEVVAQIGQSYQAASDWLKEKGIHFYYVQCVDKHTIYPERFISTVKQIGSVSKTDQVLTYLENETTVNAIYFKGVLAESREQYDVFGHWGDSSHWTDRGAYIAYRYMMDRINESTNYDLKVLEESDYVITEKRQYGPEGQVEHVESFEIADSKAKKTDVSVQGKWAEDHRHSVWENPDAPNDYRLLIMGDSYFNNHLVDELAESVREVWLVWGDYTYEFTDVVEHCNPDIVIYEYAERVDRSGAVIKMAESLIETN